jgi:hypothetical protein
LPASFACLARGGRHVVKLDDEPPHQYRFSSSSRIQICPINNSP